VTPPALALASAFCSALATIFIQRGLERSNFYAGFWINVVVGMVGLWAIVPFTFLTRNTPGGPCPTSCSPA
jgi:drug/metabolite transporter (DMT)-like permease